MTIKRPQITWAQKRSGEVIFIFAVDTNCPATLSIEETDSNPILRFRAECLDGEYLFERALFGGVAEVGVQTLQPVLGGLRAVLHRNEGYWPRPFAVKTEVGVDWAEWEEEDASEPPADDGDFGF